MTLLEGIFIVIGFFCICISFFVAGKSREEKEEEQSDSGVASSVWSEKDEKIIQERVEEILVERQTELVDETEDKMNRLCNEKIMAIDEFSRQILEKIDNNHQEVVFMYNMLNEKEKEIKNVVIRPIKEEAAVEKEKKTVAKAEKETAVKAEKKATPEKPKKESVRQKETVKTEKKKETQDVKVPGNVNLQIQKMYKEGKSILEISKALDIGQGEVKLVIALYGGRVR